MKKWLENHKITGRKIPREIETKKIVALLSPRKKFVVEKITLTDLVTKPEDEKQKGKQVRTLHGKSNVENTFWVYTKKGRVTPPVWRL